MDVVIKFSKDVLSVHIKKNIKNLVAEEDE